MFEGIRQRLGRMQAVLAHILCLSGLDALSEVHVRRSALRSVLLYCMAIQVLMGGLALYQGAFVLAAALFGFFAVYAMAFLMGRRYSDFATWILIGGLYLAALLTVLSFARPSIQRLGLLFCYAVPLLAGVLLSHRLSMLFMALNLVPFVLLVSGFALSDSVVSGDVFLEIHSLFFVLLNVCLPAAVFHVLQGVRGAFGELEATHALYEDLFEHSGAASIVCDAEGRVLRANEVFAHLIPQRSAESFSGMFLASILAPRDERGSEALSRMQLTRGSEWILPAGAGAPRRLLVSNVVHTAQGNHAIHFSDVTELRRIQDDLYESEAKARYLAHHDAQTGLPNRTSMLTWLARCMRDPTLDSAMPLVALRLNVLRQVNARYGSGEGDKALARFARELARRVPQGGFLARVRGVVFAVALPPGRSPQEAQLAAERFVDGVPLEIEVGGGCTEVSINAGVVLHPGDSDGPAELLRHAEVALDLARRRGIRLVAFNRASAESVSREVAIEVALPHALSLHELDVAYQPKVSANGRLLGFEALLRWSNPALGAVSPSEFITLAEEAGCMTQLTDFVLNSVCQQIAAWRQRGLAPPPVAINLSERDLERSDLFEQITRVAGRYGIPAEALEIEITETFLARQDEKTILQLQRLRDASFRIAIDDFGAGYSSLAKLAELPLSVLKIDRAFLRGLPYDPRRSRVIRSIVMLARSLDLQIVAEGVENEGQLAFLEALECDAYQGFLFHPPAPANQWDELIATKGLHQPSHTWSFELAPHGKIEF